MFRTAAIIVGIVVMAFSASAQQTVAPNAQTTVHQAKAAALLVTEDFQRGELLDEIGALEAKIGDLEHASVIANRAYPHDYRTLIAIGEYAGTLPDGDKRILSLRPPLPRSSVATALWGIAQHYAKQGNFDRAFAVVAEMNAPEVQGDSFRAIGKIQAEAGDYDGARKTFSRAGRDPRDKMSPEDVELEIADAELTRGEVDAAHATIAALHQDFVVTAGLLGGVNALLKMNKPEIAAQWLEEAMKRMPAREDLAFLRYMALPLEIKLGQKNRAFAEAVSLPKEFTLKAYGAIAVACAQMKDEGCIADAFSKLNEAAKSEDIGGYEAKLLTLDVTGAQIDTGSYDQADGLLTSTSARLSDTDRVGALVPEMSLQRVVLLALQRRFAEARKLALTIRADSVAEHERGDALRYVARLETAESRSVPPWAGSLTDPEDRGYALLGAADALLGTSTVQLPYNEILVH